MVAQLGSPQGKGCEILELESPRAIPDAGQNDVGGVEMHVDLQPGARRTAGRAGMAHREPIES